MSRLLLLLLLVAGCATTQSVGSVWLEIPVIPTGATECCEIETCAMVRLSYPNTYPDIPVCGVTRILVKIKGAQ